MKLNIIKIFIIIIFLCASLISIYKGFYNAQKISFDFHYSPTKLVSQGINHYQYILENKHDGSLNDEIKYAQNGNYAQGLFVILLPFTFLDWDNAKLVWSIINIIIAISIPIVLSKKFDLNNFQTFIVSTIFLSSTIFRIHIGYGQQTLLMFIFFILPFVKMTNLNIILSGIAFFKYNIGYGLFLYIASLRKFKLILLSCIPLVLGWLIYCSITNTNLITNIFEPLKVILFWNSNENHFPVTIFSLLKYFNLNSLIILIIPILINFYLLLKLRYLSDQLLILSLLCLSILAFTPHQLHDYVLLIPMLIYSIKNFNSIYSKINIIFIIYVFYGLRIISVFTNLQPWDFPYGVMGYVNNTITMMILLINIYYINKKIS